MSKTVWTTRGGSIIEASPLTGYCRVVRPDFPTGRILTQLAPLPSQSHPPSTYCTLLTPLTTPFNTTLSSLSTLIKRSLHKYTFHALASYSALSPRQDRWNEFITRRAERKENELKEGLNALRGVCCAISLSSLQTSNKQDWGGAERLGQVALTSQPSYVVP